METFGLALSVISTCIDLAQQIDSLVKKFKDARSEVREGAKTVASTRRLLSQFHEMFEKSHLPQDILQDCVDRMIPLQAELEKIQSFLNLYLPLCSRKGLAGLAWRYRWGKEIDKHQKNLAQLNDHLNSTLLTLSFKVGFKALEAIHVGSPALDEKTQPVIEETLSAIGRQYFEAAQDLRAREWYCEPPITQIQRTYSIAAKALQVEEWNGPFRSARIAFAVGRVR